MYIPEDALTQLAEESGFSGVIVVDRPEKPHLNLAFGFANRAAEVPNTISTRFGLASGTKPFTAVAILHLVETGRLDLDDSVRGLLGNVIPNVDEGVTVRHLLTHRSGVGDYLHESDGWVFDDYVMSVPPHTLVTARDYLPMLAHLPQLSPPGKRFDYNNGAFVLLALIAEVASGSDFHQLVKDVVFDPAGMTSAEFLRLDELPPDAALGYLYLQGHRTNVLHLPVVGSGDGGCFANAHDLSRFWNALDAGRLLQPETVALMRTATQDEPGDSMRYGLGFWLHKEKPVSIMEGQDAGVSLRSLHDASSGVTATVISNTSEGAWPIAEMLLGRFD